MLSLCGEYIDNDFEKYKFEWKGKADCLRLAQKRSTGTLRPCRPEDIVILMRSPGSRSAAFAAALAEKLGYRLDRPYPAYLLDQTGP